MNELSELRRKLESSKDYRDGYVEAHLKRGLPAQIRALRKQRGWKQDRLASESGLSQGVISRAENPNYGNLTFNTVLRIAAGFDVAFIGRYVPFSELGKWVAGLESETQLYVPSFESDAGFAAKIPPRSSGSQLDAETPRGQCESGISNGNLVIHDFSIPTPLPTEFLSSARSSEALGYGEVRNA